jgi:hypothetical protein
MGPMTKKPMTSFINTAKKSKISSPRIIDEANYFSFNNNH